MWELGGNWIVAMIMEKVAMIIEEVAMILEIVAMINTKVATIENLEQHDFLNKSSTSLTIRESKFVSPTLTRWAAFFVGESSGDYEEIG